MMNFNIIYFTIIKDLNDIEQKIFTKALKNLNKYFSNLYKAIDRMKKFQMKNIKNDKN